MQGAVSLGCTQGCACANASVGMPSTPGTHSLVASGHRKISWIVVADSSGAVVAVGIHCELRLIWCRSGIRLQQLLLGKRCPCKGI